jgi:hypothetical protein
MFIGILKGLRGRARQPVRPPPPIRQPPGDLANQPPPPYVSQPAPSYALHAGADGVQVTAAGAGGGGTPRKGKTFRGGSKQTRDNWYGYDRDKSFVMWWHRQGKHEFGGNDIDSAAEAKAMYEYWLQIGKPVPK